MAKEYLDRLSVFMEIVTSGISDGPHLECRHFFSGAAVYAEGRICITLSPVGLALKLPRDTREHLLQNNMAIPLRYFPKGPVKLGYVLFPGGVTSEAKNLPEIVKQSIEYVLTQPMLK